MRLLTRCGCVSFAIAIVDAFLEYVIVAVIDVFIAATISGFAIVLQV